MKKILLLSTLLTMSGFFFGGCSSLENALFNEKPATGQVIDGVPVNDADRLLVTKPSVDAITNIIKTFPVPFADTVGTLLGLGLAGYTIYLRKRSVSKQDALESVVFGVKDVVDSFATETEKLRAIKILKDKQIQDGTRNEVRKLI